MSNKWCSQTNKVWINAHLLTAALRMQMPGFMRLRRPLMFVTVAVKLVFVSKHHLTDITLWCSCRHFLSHYSPTSVSAQQKVDSSRARAENLNTDMRAIPADLQDTDWNQLERKGTLLCSVADIYSWAHLRSSVWTCEGFTWGFYISSTVSVHPNMD